MKRCRRPDHRGHSPSEKPPRSALHSPTLMRKSLVSVDLPSAVYQVVTRRARHFKHSSWVRSEFSDWPLLRRIYITRNATVYRRADYLDDEQRDTRAMRVLLAAATTRDGTSHSLTRREVSVDSAKNFTSAWCCTHSLFST